MIKGADLLNGCVNEIMQVVSGLEAAYGEINITSGYRSEQRNKEVGGSKTSLHMSGKAIDVFIKNVSPIKVAAFVMNKYPVVKGIGINVYQGWAHFDVRPEKNIVFWAYNKSGVEA